MNNIENIINSIKCINESNGIVDEVIISNIINDNLNGLNNNPSEIFDSIPILPYFLPEDIENFINTPVYSERCYECKINKHKWLDIYRLLTNGIMTENTKDYIKEWNDEINELYIKLRNETNINIINSIKQTILELGWNPELEFDSDTKMKVRNSNINKLKHKYDKYIYNIIDLQNLLDENSSLNESFQDDNRKYPIFVLLTYIKSGVAKIITKYTKGIYSHAAICLDSDLERIYSYNIIDNGFSIESIDKYLKQDKNSNMVLYTILIDKKDLLKIKSKLDYFLLNRKKTKYSILNILGILVNKPVELANDMICSQFVDYILKSIDIDVTNKNSGLVTPNDFYISMNPKLFKIYEGKIADYDKSKIDNLINSIINKSLYTKDGMNITKYFNQMIISESKEFPIQFDDEGNLLIKRMKYLDIDEEYFKSHKILEIYRKSNNIEGIKYELSKLWFLNSILEKKIYKEPDSTLKSNYHKSRARILNDFNKYLEIVTKEDNNFNFTVYYNNSPFSDVTIKIDKNTLYYGGELLKNISKLIMY